jgi:hypothetical protein
MITVTTYLVNGRRATIITRKNANPGEWTTINITPVDYPIGWFRISN